MKILLIGINSSYSHYALSLYYLKAYFLGQNNDTTISISEFTTEDTNETIMESIYKEKPDIIGFSCYIWNISKVIDISFNIKKILTNTKIILGGPEVGLNPRTILINNPHIDFIISNDGEKPFYDLCMALLGNGDFSNISGINYFNNDKYFSNLSIEVDLTNLPSPYLMGLVPLNKPYVHFETSRGCVFKCAFCTSSKDKKIWYFPIDRIYDELLLLKTKNVKYINILDRSFTVNKKRALKLMELFSREFVDTKFHFEINPDLLDPDFFIFLKNQKNINFQFEMGIQTTNI